MQNYFALEVLINIKHEISQIISPIDQAFSFHQSANPPIHQSANQLILQIKQMPTLSTIFLQNC
jgi:hypothetical protein